MNPSPTACRYFARAALLGLLAGGLTVADRRRPEPPGVPDVTGLVAVQREIRREFPFMPGGRLTVDSGQMGGIAVQGWDRPRVVVTATLTAWGQTEAMAQAGLDTLDVRMNRTETDITVQTIHPKLFRLGKADFRIRVPRHRTDLKAQARVGVIDLRDFNGWVEADTRLGSLCLAGLRGYVSATTPRGDVLVHLVGGRWEGLQCSASTGHGRVRLFLPVQYHADLTLIARQGQLTVDYPTFQVDGEVQALVPLARKDGWFISRKLRDGGPSVVLQTLGGDLEVVGYDPDLDDLTLPLPAIDTPANGEGRP